VSSLVLCCGGLVDFDGKADRIKRGSDIDVLELADSAKPLENVFRESLVKGCDPLLSFVGSEIIPLPWVSLR
jgi:hypothetical protein